MKQRVRYKLGFDSRWAYASALLMGTAFFLQAIYYFVFADLPQIGVQEIVLNLILPLALEAVWFLLLRGIKINAPGLYAIVIALICILLAVQGLFCGNVLRAVFCVVWYLLAAVVVILVAGGYMPYRVMIVTVFFIPLCVQAVIVYQQYLALGKYWESLLELARTLCVGSLLLFSGVLIPGKRA